MRNYLAVVSALALIGYSSGIPAVTSPISVSSTTKESESRLFDDSEDLTTIKTSTVLTKASTSHTPSEVFAKRLPEESTTHRLAATSTVLNKSSTSHTPSDVFAKRLPEESTTHRLAVSSTSARSTTAGSKSTSHFSTTPSKLAHTTQAVRRITPKRNRGCSGNKKDHILRIHVGEGQVVFFSGACGPKSCALKKDIVSGLGPAN